MSKYYKVALAVDEIDYPIITDEVSVIDSLTAIDVSRSVSTPDNTYICVYWDDICWDMQEVRPLLNKLESIRHALITIDEEGDIWKDIEVSDSRGTDEEFYELLSWTADICIWEDGAPLTPVNTYIPSNMRYVPISRERALQILASYVDNDLHATETDYVYQALANAGATDAEIKALGFGCCN